jgi:hypothetical protein
MKVVIHNYLPTKDVGSVKIIRKDLDGSTIEQTPGSSGYRVYFKGKFVSFFTTASEANSLLNKLQAKEN